MLRFLPLLMLGALLVTAGAVAQVPQAYNTTLFGTLNPEPPSGGGRYSALWGYTAPNGREYALLGGNTGTHIIDVTVSPIKEVAFIAGPQSGWREMKTYGTYAYVVSEGGGGLQIIDLSKLPASATLVKSETSRFTTAHTVAQQGKYLYVNGTGAGTGVNGGTIIFDLTNPTQPRELGSWKTRYVHDCVVRNDTMYAAAINDGKLDIVYLGADRATPTYVTSVEYPGAGTHNADLTPDGSYVMTTDEINSTPKTLKVWDIRDIGNIAKVADFTPVPGEIIHNVHMKGSTAYIAWYSAGTRIVDMSVPSRPAEIGYFDTYPGAVNNYVGNWETYPYLPSGKILASDMQTGLHVFTFNGAKRGSIHGVVRNASSGEPVPGAVIKITKFGRTITADAGGQYQYDGAVDSLSFTAGALNYQDVNGTLVLAETERAEDILLPPLELATFTVDVIDAGTKAMLTTYAYSVVERPLANGLTSGAPHTFALPKDSTYHLYVGAWGYRPKLVPIQNANGTVTVALDSGYYDDAELDLGWRLGMPGDDARGGVWERGVPVGTTANGRDVIQPGSDNTPEPFDHAFITGIRNSEGGPGANDVDDGRTRLVSPAMDLSTYRNPIITCALWYSRDARTDAINDTLDVDLSIDNGATWTTMERITASPGTWTPRRYRVRDYYVSAGAQTLFRVVASDLFAQSLVEAGLDDFAVADSGRPQAAVPYDLAFGAKARLAPNPCSSAASITVELAVPQRRMRIALFDANGNFVRSVYGGAANAGVQEIPVDVTGLPSGSYHWRVGLDGGQHIDGAMLIVR